MLAEPAGFPNHSLFRSRMGGAFFIVSSIAFANSSGSVFLSIGSIPWWNQALFL